MTKEFWSSMEKLYLSVWPEFPPQENLGATLRQVGAVLSSPLSERDLWIAQQVAPTLVEKGLIFVGLDVIGDYLTEINVTSPTCVREIDKAENTAIGNKLMIAINKRFKRVVS